MPLSRRKTKKPKWFLKKTTKKLAKGLLEVKYVFKPKAKRRK